MAEAIGMTLAVVALVEPAIKSTFEAYGVYRLTEAFGVDFGEYSRKLEGQRARLHAWSQWPIGSVPSPENNSTSVILQELAAMKVEFDNCAALRAKYQSDSSKDSKSNALDDFFVRFTNRIRSDVRFISSERAETDKKILSSSYFWS